MSEHSHAGLNEDARALLRAASGGATPSELQREQVLEQFWQRVEHSQVRSRASLFRGVSNVTARVLASARSRVLPGAVAAAVLTGSVAAFGGWAALQRGLEPLLSKSADSAADDTPPSTQSRAAQPRAAQPGSMNVPEAPSAPPSEAPRVVEQASQPSAPSVVGSVSSQLEPAAPAPSDTDRRSTAHATQRSTLSRSRVSNLGLELDLIQRARDALQRGEPGVARELAASYRARFPQGDLREESAAIEALADCRERGASERGAAFVRRWPNSVLCARVRADCKLPSISVPEKPPGDTQ